MLTIVLRPATAGRVEAWLGGDLLCVSHQPALDGARELLKLGRNPAELMTTRWQGKDFDNFVPRPIRDFAALTVQDSKRGTPSFVKFRPFPSGGAVKEEG